MSESNKFTPGPWVINKSPFEVYNVDHGRLTHEICAGNIMIAALYMAPESQDAALISAAPDLLEALEAVMRAHDLGTHNFNAHDLAAKAISKARGQQ